MSQDISGLRQDYQVGELKRGDLDDDPIKQFRLWFSAALKACKEPNAMTLATVQGDQPQARVVLLKDLSKGGFVFYTNKNSAKGDALMDNPKVSLCFWWEALERQVRIEGRVNDVSDAEATEYFHSRPRASQLGAWASMQSQPLSNDNELEQRFKKVASMYPEEVPKPPYWGGYRVVPYAIEFWQGRSSRLHDRFRYERNTGGWDITRLMP